MAGETLGAATVCNIERSEDDTDDILIVLTNAAGDPAEVNGWPGVLRIGTTNAGPIVGSPQAEFTGTGGIGTGIITIDMANFAVPPGSYKYDVRVTDLSQADTPSRVYFRGNFKVVERIT